QEVGARQHQDRERNACLFTTRQRTRRSLDAVTREVEAAQVSLHLAAVPERAQVVDDREERALGRYLRHVLPVVCDVDRLAHPDAAAVERALTDDRAHERGFAGTVRSDQTDHLATRDTCSETIE